MTVMILFYFVFPQIHFCATKQHQNLTQGTRLTPKSMLFKILRNKGLAGAQ